MDTTRYTTALSPRNAPKMVVECAQHFPTRCRKDFPRKPETGKERNSETTNCSVTTATQKKNEMTSCLPCVSGVKGLLQITEVELQISENFERVLVFCDWACSRSWITSELARELDVPGTPTKLTKHGIKSNKNVDIQMVEHKLTTVHSGGSCSSLFVKPRVRDKLTIGKDVIDVEDLKTRLSTLRTNRSLQVQLHRCKNDSWSGRFPLYPPTRVFRIRPQKYPSCHSFTVGLGTEWTTSVEHVSVFDMLWSCYPERAQLYTLRPTSKLVRHGIVWRV